MHLIIESNLEESAPRGHEGTLAASSKLASDNASRRSIITPAGPQVHKLHLRGISRTEDSYGGIGEPYNTPNQNFMVLYTYMG